MTVAEYMKARKDKYPNGRCPWSNEIENPCTKCGECQVSKLVDVDYHKELLNYAVF